MENIFSQLKSNWVVFSLVVSLVLWYGNTNTRIEAIEAKQIEQATLQDKLNKLITDVEVLKVQGKENEKKIDNVSGKLDYLINKTQ